MGGRGGPPPGKCYGSGKDSVPHWRALPPCRRFRRPLPDPSPASPHPLHCLSPTCPQSVISAKAGTSRNGKMPQGVSSSLAGDGPCFTWNMRMEDAGSGVSSSVRCFTWNVCPPPSSPSGAFGKPRRTRGTQRAESISCPRGQAPSSVLTVLSVFSVVFRNPNPGQGSARGCLRTSASPGWRSSCLAGLLLRLFQKVLGGRRSGGLAAAKFSLMSSVPEGRVPRLG